MVSKEYERMLDEAFNEASQALSIMVCELAEQFIERGLTVEDAQTELRGALENVLETLDEEGFEGKGNCCESCDGCRCEDDDEDA